MLAGTCTPAIDLRDQLRVDLQAQHVVRAVRVRQEAEHILQGVRAVIPRGGREVGNKRLREREASDSV